MQAAGRAVFGTGRGFLRVRSWGRLLGWARAWGVGAAFRVGYGLWVWAGRGFRCSAGRAPGAIFRPGTVLGGAAFGCGLGPARFWAGRGRFAVAWTFMRRARSLGRPDFWGRGFWSGVLGRRGFRVECGLCAGGTDYGPGVVLGCGFWAGVVLRVGGGSWARRFIFCVADAIQVTLGAFREAGDTQGAPVKDDLVREQDPLLLRDDLDEILLDFDRVRVLREVQALRDALTWVSTTMPDAIP